MGCAVVVGGASRAERAAIERLFAERDRMFSRFQPGSELNRVNDAAGYTDARVATSSRRCSGSRSRPGARAAASSTRRFGAAARGGRLRPGLLAARRDGPPTSTAVTRSERQRLDRAHLGARAARDAARPQRRGQGTDRRRRARADLRRRLRLGRRRPGDPGRDRRRAAGRRNGAPRAGRARDQRHRPPPLGARRTRSSTT